jgi:transcriptional regulator with XRE-family HTH domain
MHVRKPLWFDQVANLATWRPAIRAASGRGKGLASRLQIRLNQRRDPELEPPGRDLPSTATERRPMTDSINSKKTIRHSAWPWLPTTGETTGMRATTRIEKGTFARELAQRLRLTRIVLNITDREAAAAFGVTPQTYRRWEAGRPSSGSAGPLVRFATKYDVSLDWLVVGDADRLAESLSKNKGGKVAILPVVPADRRKQINLTVQS